MSEEMKSIRAKEVFDALCKTLENREWSFDKDEEALVINTGAKGEDLPIPLLIVVDKDRQLVRLLSPFLFNMNEDKRLDGAIASCVASYGLNDGNFDYNLSTGEIIFRMTESYRETIVGEEMLNYMISFSAAVIEKYNDKFYALNEGTLTIDEFISAE